MKLKVKFQISSFKFETSKTNRENQKVASQIEILSAHTHTLYMPTTHTMSG